MIYIDTSSLLKLVIQEPESPAAIRSVSEESLVLVSSFTELECRVQMQALERAGSVRRARMTKAKTAFASLLKFSPFRQVSLQGSVFETALLQLARGGIHCRSLDRLHLAAMEELGVSRLMTHDGRQAQAAKELGYEVVVPGRD